ncbi:hypothetical protein BDA99DRAFT_15390 [Phascolomyces articulosus]|uniref:RRM domain-containing protein n=1 Tax=Phascolomyces articulosus TaxID=60185 RepID=A0AAD5KCG9_9FUNG|nr:hypothetical protein BDA99DRAFT_15390 [Phascolomyces articulosus]
MSEYNNSSERSVSPSVNNNHNNNEQVELKEQQPINDKDPAEQQQQTVYEDLVINDVMDERDMTMDPAPYSSSSSAHLPRSRSRQRSRSRDGSYSPYNNKRDTPIRSTSRHETTSPDRRPHYRSSHGKYSDEEDYYSSSANHPPPPHRHASAGGHAGGSSSHGRHGSYSPRRRRRSSSRRRYRSRSRSPSRSRRSSGRYKGCRVYVGNLAYDCRRSDLKSFAKEAGTVVHTEILASPGGRSKGCGIVEYSRAEYAERAMRVLNRLEFMGRPVFVREDREFEPKIPKDPRDAPEDQRLWVGNLPFSTSWQDLKDLFRKAGRVTHTDIDTDPETRRSKGTGLVIYEDPRDAKAAIKMLHGSEYRGRILQVFEERNAPPPLPQPEIREHKERGEDYRGRPPPSGYNEPYHHHHHHHPPPYDSGTATAAAVVGVPPPPPQYAPMGLVGGPGASMPSHGPNQIFVTNLPFSTTWQDLIDLFRHVGPVVRAEIQTINGHPKGSGLVRFEQFAICEKAIGKFNGYLYGGRYLDVRLDKFSTPG